MANVTWPNPPAPETLLPERTGADFLGGSDPAGERVKGYQPITDTNPEGDYPGIPLVAIRG